MKTFPKILLAILGLLFAAPAGFGKETAPNLAPQTMLNLLGKEWSLTTAKEWNQESLRYHKTLETTENGILKRRRREYVVCHTKETENSRKDTQVIIPAAGVPRVTGDEEELLFLLIEEKNGRCSTEGIFIPKESRALGLFLKHLGLELPNYQQLAKETPHLLWDSVRFDAKEKDENSFQPLYSIEWKNNFRGLLDIILYIKGGNIKGMGIESSKKDEPNVPPQTNSAPAPDERKSVDIGFLSGGFSVGDSEKREHADNRFFQRKKWDENRAAAFLRQNAETNQKQLEKLRNAGFERCLQFYEEDYFRVHVSDRREYTAYRGNIRIKFRGEGYFPGIGNRYRPLGVLVKMTSPAISIKFHKEIDLPETYKECKERFPVLYEHTRLDGKVRIVACGDISFRFHDGKLFSYYRSLSTSIPAPRTPGLELLPIHSVAEKRPAGTK